MSLDTLLDMMTGAAFGLAGLNLWRMVNAPRMDRRSLNQQFRKTHWALKAKGPDAAREAALSAVEAFMTTGLPATAATIALVLERAFPGDSWPWDDTL